MEISLLVKFGQVISVLEVVQSFTAVSIRPQQVLNNTVATVTYRQAASLDFGVTGMMVTLQ